MENIHIFIASDENYAQHAGVTIISILENCSSAYQLTINFLNGGVSTKNLNFLEDIVTKYGSTFIIYDVNEEEYNNLYVNRHISKATYFRLAIPDLLPREVEKAIYLDTDTIVRHDIKELWENDISNYYIGAVTNKWINDNPSLIAGLGIPQTEAYFNAGVLLINCLKWREDKIGEKVMQFLNSNGNLRFHDQDALNGVLWGKWLALDPKWNVYKALFSQYYKIKRKKPFGPEFIEAVKDPYIVHFTGPVKPWHYACASPYTQDYYKYLAISPWKGYHPTDFSLTSLGKRYEWILKCKIRSWINTLRKYN